MLSSQQRSPSQKSKLAHMGNRNCYFVPEPCLASAPEKRQGRLLSKEGRTQMLSQPPQQRDMQSR
jgi:hypothetical protein